MLSPACQTARKPEQVRRRRTVGFATLHAPGEFEWRHSKVPNQGRQPDCDRCTRFVLGSGPRFCDSQSTCRKKYSGKYRAIELAKSQRLCRLMCGRPLAFRQVRPFEFGLRPVIVGIVRIAGLTPVVPSRRLLPCFLMQTIRVTPGSFANASEQPARDRCQNSTMILMPCSSCR